MAEFYNPSHFRVDDGAKLSMFLNTFPFATLLTSNAAEISVSHLPLKVVASDDGTPSLLRGHVARANSHWREIGEGIDALAIFNGPQAYVTPQWYASKKEHGKVVPTWNYAVVHVRGRVRAITDPTELHGLVSDLSDTHEKPFAQPWAVSDAPDDYIDKMLKAIVGLEMTVTHIEGKWKLSQNRDAKDQAGIIAGLAARGDANSQAVHALMTKT